MKNWMQLSDFIFTFHFHALEKEMTTHSSVLAWRIPGTREPGGLLSMGSHRVRDDWCDLTAAAAHPYVTTGKSIALTRGTFVGKLMSLLFNMLSRLVITFLPRSKCLLISRLRSPSAVILEPPKIKSATVSTVSPSICLEVMGLDVMILVFWMLSLWTLKCLQFRNYWYTILSALKIILLALLYWIMLCNY